MAEVFHGKNAVAYWGDTGWTAFSQMTEWSCTIAVDTAESHAMHNSSLGKTRESGFKFGSASITCKVSGDNLVDEGDTGTLSLWRNTISTDKGYQGAAICLGADVSVDKDDIEIVTYNFQFNSTITNAVSTA